MSLHASILAAGGLSSCVEIGVGVRETWGGLTGGSAFFAPRSTLRGRSVLLEMANAFDAAEALIQLDGLVKRIVLYPPDMSRGHLTFVAESAETDMILTKDVNLKRNLEAVLRKRRLSAASPAGLKEKIETEWILLTSGTTGVPKLVIHTLASLTGAIAPRKALVKPPVWSTFYDIRRYGGLQIFLRAAVTGTPLLLSDSEESLTDFLIRAGSRGVTHISGTPSQWRRVLMNPSANSIAPKYIRLSGEIADQAILNQLQYKYRNANIVHAFASTEAGVVLEVNDAAMGIPASAIGRTASVETKVLDGTLRVRSNRTASAYLGRGSLALRDVDGFVDTGDVLELRDDRYYFAGRRDGTINVGGLKVHPEEVEAVLNRHPEVGMSLVRMRRSSITGSLVVADVVLRRASHPKHATRVLQHDILNFCRAQLAIYKVPVGINFVPTLAIAKSGKLIRHHA